MPPQTRQRHSKYHKLGKVVTQVEMSNPETRKQLRDILEAQIKEKSMKKENESNQMRVY
jgi:hypothetical protein